MDDLLRLLGDAENEWLGFQEELETLEAELGGS